MLLIFDVDGTLIDSRAFILECARRTFADCPVPYPGDAAFLATIGLLPERMMDRLFPEHPPEQRAWLAGRYIEQAWAIRETEAVSERPYDGIEDLLAAVSGVGRTLGIATGKKRRGVDHMLERTSWGTRFRTLQTAESGPSKPDPTLIRRAMSETGHDPASTVMIGDSSFDMLMAKAAGVTAVAVGWGYNDLPSLRQAGADHLADSVAGLRDLLLGMRPQP